MSQLNPSTTKRRLAPALLILLAATTPSLAGSPAAVPGLRATLRATLTENSGKPASSGLGLLESLLTASASSKPTAAATASALLEAGPEATEQLYGLLHDRAALRAAGLKIPSVQRQRIDSTLDEASRVVVKITALPGLTTRDRAHACGVALEVLVATPVLKAAPLLERMLQSVAGKRLPASFRDRLEFAVERMCSDPDLGPSELSRWILVAGQEFTTAIVDGAGRAQVPMKLVRCLDRFAGNTSGAEGLILNRVAGMIQRGVPVVADETAKAVTPFLTHSGGFERREAASVLGMIGDRRHVGALIKGLDDSEHMVRTAALEALQTLTGMTISGDAGRWKLWHTEQEAWWANNGANLVASITSVPRTELVAVLKDVSHRRLYRREIAHQLVQLLGRRDVDEVRLAVASLTMLRDPSTLSAILELREHPSPLVKGSVEDAVTAFRHAGIKPSRVRSLPSD